MANAYFDIDNGSQLVPFIMGGLGYAMVDAEIAGVSDEDSSWAAQVGVGMNYKLNDDVSVGLSYRFFYIDDLDFSGVEAEYSSHRAMLGFTFNL